MPISIYIQNRYRGTRAPYLNIVLNNFTSVLGIGGIKKKQILLGIILDMGYVLPDKVSNYINIATQISHCSSIWDTIFYIIRYKQSVTIWSSQSPVLYTYRKLPVQYLYYTSCHGQYKPHLQSACKQKVRSSLFSQCTQISHCTNLMNKYRRKREREEVNITAVTSTVTGSSSTSPWVCMFALSLSISLSLQRLFMQHEAPFFNLSISFFLPFSIRCMLLSASVS